MLDINLLNESRIAQSLLTISEIMELSRLGNIIYDPFSALISRRCRLGVGNVLFPCVYLLCQEDGALTIGDNNTFYTNTLISAETSLISIGSNNQFGENGFTAKANRENANIQIGSFGRYLGGACVFGSSFLGSGSQILGAINVDSCQLEQGESYHGSDPGLRAGLLKGTGTARNLVVPVGHVIAGNGTFLADDLKTQLSFHPAT